MRFLAKNSNFTPLFLGYFNNFSVQYIKKEVRQLNTRAEPQAEK